MCEGCNDNSIPYTESDLKLEFRNETGLNPESNKNSYEEWLELRIIDQRNQENTVCKANDEIQKVMVDELNNKDETDYLLSSKANAKHIQDSIDEFEKGEAQTRELIDE